MRRILKLLICLSLITSSALCDEGSSKLERTKALIAENQTSQISGSREESQPSGLRAVRGLAITLGVFLIGAFIYQKLYKKSLGASGGSSPVLTRMKVSHNTEVSLIEIDGKKFVVLVSSTGVALHPWGEG